MQNIDNLRRKLDDIDSKILGKLADRQALSLQIGRYKRLNKLPVRDGRREEKALNLRIKEGGKRGISARLIKTLFQAVFAESRRVQRKDAGFDKNAKN